MFKKLIPVIFILGVSIAEEKKCDFYPVKPMKPLYYGQLMIDRFEHAIDNKNNLDYEITGWYGGDYRRLWVEIEGSHSTLRREGEIEKGDILFGKLISPFWDIRGGIGYKDSYGDEGSNRNMFVIGLKGLAPYMFEVDTNIRLTTKGEIFGDLEAEYDIYLTQRLAFQPRFDITYSFTQIKDLSVGTGLNELSISGRLRYELKREIAPYIGISWVKLFGETRYLAKDEGKKSSYTDIFLGLRMWF